MTLTLKTGCVALALAVTLGVAQAGGFDDMSPEAADAVLDLALAEAESCPVVFDLTAQSATQMEILLLAPCHAGENVVLDHSGMMFRVPTSENGALSASLPVLDAEAVVTLTFADGSMADARLVMPAISDIQDVAARF